jgi:hypothetical protein
MQQRYGDGSGTECGSNRAWRCAFNLLGKLHWHNGKNKVNERDHQDNCQRRDGETERHRVARKGCSCSISALPHGLCASSNTTRTRSCCPLNKRGRVESKVGLFVPNSSVRLIETPLILPILPSIALEDNKSISLHCNRA